MRLVFNNPTTRRRERVVCGKKAKSAYHDNLTQAVANHTGLPLDKVAAAHRHRPLTRSAKRKNNIKHI